MADHTRIEWSDATWNPVTGCTRVSPGCEHCYIDWAPPMRIEGRHFTDPRTGERSNRIGANMPVRLHPDRLDQPLRWRKPRRVFVNSLSDLFHDDVPDDYIANVWAVMTLAQNHTFQVLTKRHARMRALLSSPDFWVVVGEHVSRIVGAPAQVDDVRALPNVWLGVTVEDQQRADLRIPALLATPAAVRFLSCEPLLGPVELPEFCACGCGAPFGPGVESILGIDWVIVGGESGPGARPMHLDWVRTLRDQVVAAGVPFFFKQWGDASAWQDRHADVWHQIYVNRMESPETALFPREHVEKKWGPLKPLSKKAAGRELDGRTWDQYPGADS